MPTLTNAVLSTVTDVFSFIKPNVGGAVPDDDTEEYADWLRWIQVRQEEFARRGFWRRLLKKTTLNLTSGDEEALLPIDFHKPNGIYVFQVGDDDWNEPLNGFQQTLFTELELDHEDANYGRWKVRFGEPVSGDGTATLWYFANPPMPTEGDDLVILPGDLLGYAIMSDYFRADGSEGSQDDARNEANNRFNEYMALEVLPNKQELLSWATYSGPRRNLTVQGRNRFSSRPGRN